MTWACDLTRDAEKQLAKLPQDAQVQIAKAIDAMEADPLTGDVKPLRGKQWQGRYRKRVGRYRLIFSVNHSKHTVLILAILLRSEKTYQ